MNCRPGDINVFSSERKYTGGSETVDGTGPSGLRTSSRTIEGNVLAVDDRVMGEAKDDEPRSSDEGLLPRVSKFPKFGVVMPNVVNSGTMGFGEHRCTQTRRRIGILQ